MTATLPPLLQAAQDRVQWRRTYSADQVGEDFTNRYGYIEIWRPKGHFHHAISRGFEGFWDKGLVYDWHHHRPEEIFYVLAGSALCRTDGASDETLVQGGHRRHSAMVGHMLETPTAPLLIFALWRGDDLGSLGVMGSAT